MKSRDTMRLWGSSPPQQQQQQAGGRRRAGVEGGGELVGGDGGCGGPAHRKSERRRRAKASAGDEEEGGGDGEDEEVEGMVIGGELTEVRVVVENVSGDEEDEDEGDEERGREGKGGRPGGVTLPLLQVWPIDRGLEDGSSFVFPPKEGVGAGSEERRDSGIDSFQASPIGECSSNGSGASGSRRESTHTFTGGRLLHPNSARYLRRSSSDRSLNAASSGVGGDEEDDDDDEVEEEDRARDGDDEGGNAGEEEEEEEEEEDLLTVEAATACARARFSAWSKQLAQERSAKCSDQPPISPLLLPVSVQSAIPTARRRSSASSYARRASSASSARSDAAPWPCSPPPSSCSSRASHRRVSLLMDALDLEYSSRGSVGGLRSFSGSFQKLTFTQSLAFPGLAAVRGLRTGHGEPPRRNRRGTSFSSVSSSSTARSGLNAFAKVVTTVVLVLISVLVFGVVYKYVRT